MHQPNSGQTGCIALFTNQGFTSSTTWPVPAGVTKINLTLIGGGFSGASGSSIAAKTLPYTSGSTINLTGEYAALKGNGITVKGCGAGGRGGKQSGWGFDKCLVGGVYKCPSDSRGGNYNACPKNTNCYDPVYCPGKHYCTNSASSGGAGGKMSCTLNIASNATQLKIVVGKVDGGYPGGNASSSGSNPKCGNGGNGGGVSYVDDGKGHFCAAGGGGGGGGSSACSAGTPPGSLCNGGTGGDGGKYNNSYGGKGGAGSLGAQGGSHLGSNGGNGTGSGGSFSNGSYCGAGQNGYIEISWPALSTPGAGGASGKCYNVNANVTPGTNCTVTIGGAGAETKLTCGGSSWSSNSGSNHSASGSTGGGGYSAKCASGSYGKGGNGGASGAGGYMYIENATTY